MIACVSFKLCKSGKVCLADLYHSNSTSSILATNFHIANRELWLCDYCMCEHPTDASILNSTTRSTRSSCIAMITSTAYNARKGMHDEALFGDEDAGSRRMTQNTFPCTSRFLYRNRASHCVSKKGQRRSNIGIIIEAWVAWKDERGLV